MTDLNILLVCSAGASSGFLAQNIRKAARKKGLEVTIEAKSDAFLESLIGSKDMVLVAPHLQFEEEMIKKLSEDAKVPYAFLPRQVYGSLDGASALALALEAIKDFKEG
ncbi:PTS sugar transporter subunit IIB [Vagococcus sp. BWB3-3]|uniref:PTS sugar transporter subunit IIB n=1 Tax=Vagococcus allomyrinae TaxID=2794353 RepID=A0A940P8R4_9ENTE|nr:PTS sugar transporter subunit IIB [Vagococcus allomyrinae]MBP1040022.1 PTS sugar transporter subunit IIB [Vagococcus allomyrinae]